MGVDLLLDTDDSQIGDYADKYFEQQRKDLEAYQALKNELTMASFAKQ